MGDGDGGAGFGDTTAGVLTGGDTDVPRTGMGEDGTDVAPAHTSTATKPRLSRRPHDECQTPPGTLVWSDGASPAGRSARSPLTSISPQTNSVYRLFFGFVENSLTTRSSLARANGKRNG
jgi:hypothetical protein